MPTPPRTGTITTAEAHDAVATVMAMLLPVHAAVTENWLVDATATAAERTVNAAYTFLYFEDADGTLVQKAPLSDLRRRSTQRAIDAFGRAALGANIDPGVTPAINEALEGERPIVTNAAELFAGLIDANAAARAQAELAIDSIAFVPLQAAGERIGGLILMLVGSTNVEHIRLLGEHVACATVNLRQAQATREAAPSESDLVRTVFDARKTESELQRELMRAERYKRDVSVAIIEATNLRLLKEQFGAALTEALVERMGAALAQHSRDIDVIGQYKESGFTMILSEATASGAKTAAQRLLAIARAAAVSEDVPGLELHLACGWATYPEDGKPTLQLFFVAERRMYDPKTQVA